MVWYRIRHRRRCQSASLMQQRPRTAGGVRSPFLSPNDCDHSAAPHGRRLAAASQPRQAHLHGHAAHLRPKLLLCRSKSNSPSSWRSSDQSQPVRPLTRLPVLPSSMHKPWVGSERQKISGLKTTHGWTANPVHLSLRPFWVRFNSPVTRLAAKLDAGFHLPRCRSFPPSAPGYFNEDKIVAGSTAAQPLSRDNVSLPRNVSP